MTDPPISLFSYMISSYSTLAPKRTLNTTTAIGIQFYNELIANNEVDSFQLLTKSSGCLGPTHYKSQKTKREGTRGYG